MVSVKKTDLLPVHKTTELPCIKINVPITIITKDIPIITIIKDNNPDVPEEFL